MLHKLNGKRIQEWAGKETWAELNNCFAHFDAGDSRRALIATINLFRNIAMETGERLGYCYPANVDKNATIFCKNTLK